MSPKYPNITVELMGHDGNAFTVIGRRCTVARESGLSEHSNGAALANDDSATVATVWLIRRAGLGQAVRLPRGRAGSVRHQSRRHDPSGGYLFLTRRPSCREALR